MSPPIATPATSLRDGSHDFDFLIGDWKAHVRRLPDRLVGSTAWVEYDGISNHKKMLDSNANFEEFEVSNAGKGLHLKAQTLRLYNPESHQWTIYPVDLAKGMLDLPPMIGQFTGDRGEFYDQEMYKGRAILVRFLWLNLSPKSARMEQSFSPDGGKSGRQTGFASFRTSMTTRLQSLGHARRLLGGLAARFPGRRWVVPAMVPEELAADFFLSNGFRPAAISQLEMAYDRPAIFSTEPLFASAHQRAA